MSSKQFPSGRPLCDGYVKYKEAKFDRLLAILTKQIITAEVADRVEYSSPPRLAALLLQRSILLY